MNIKDVFYGILGLGLLVLLWLFIDERKKSELKDRVIDKLTKENEKLQLGYLTLLEKILKKSRKSSS